MWWSKTRWILAAIVILAVVMANPFRPWSPQQKFYRELSDRHAILAAECRKREALVRSQGDLDQANRLGHLAEEHDRQSRMFRRGAYESDETRRRRVNLP